MPGLTISTDTASAPPRRDSSPSRPPVSPITPTLVPASLVSTPAHQPVPPPPMLPPLHHLQQQPGSQRPHPTAAAGRAHGRPTTHIPAPQVPAPPPPNFAAGRPVLTHSTQPDHSRQQQQSGGSGSAGGSSGSGPPPAVVMPAPPPPVPLDFDANPDVLALKSAIAILQLQRARAEADMRTLSAARGAALAEPGAFMADLGSGQVRTDGDRLFAAAAGAPPRRGSGEGPDGEEEEEDDDDDDDSSSEDEDDDEEGSEGAQGVKKEEDGDGQQQSKSGDKPSKRKSKAGKRKPEDEKPWKTLPKPQNVVRCPPVNWSQYAVVGESLDKLHADQQRAPTIGAPAVFGANGTYEFGGRGGDQRGFVGIAAPYQPGKDKIDKKGKGAKR